MFRKELVLGAVVVLAFWACDLHATQIASTWVGAQSGNWGDASNWNPAIVPDNAEGNTFAVTIDSNGIAVDGVEIWLYQSRTIDQLDCYGDVELRQGGPYRTWILLTLMDVNGLTNYGVFYLGAIVISGNVTNATGAYIEFEEADIWGNVYNLADATILCVYEVIEIDGNVENAGVIKIGATASFVAKSYLNNTGQIQLDGGECVVGIFYNNSTGVIRGCGNIVTEDQAELLQNEGLISASSGSLCIATANNTISNNGILRSEPGCFLHVKPLFPGPGQADVNNTGRIEVKSGGGVTFYCDLLNQANGEIELLGGTLAATTITHSPGATLEGFGNVAGDVILEDGGIVKLTGSTNIVGDVTIGTIATLEISDGTTLITGYTTNNGAIHMKGGRIIPQGGFTNNGNIIWEPGPYNNIADFNLDGQVNFKDFADFAETWLWQAQL